MSIQSERAFKLTKSNHGESSGSKIDCKSSAIK